MFGIVVLLLLFLHQTFQESTTALLLVCFVHLFAGLLEIFEHEFVDVSLAPRCFQQGFGHIMAAFGIRRQKLSTAREKQRKRIGG